MKSATKTAARAPEAAAVERGPETEGEAGGTRAAITEIGVAEVLARLLAFWRAQGCAALVPCELAVPVAGMHPQAFFALLGPRPWRAVFPQWVRRPADGRFGEHPYRLARHLQLQVTLKPPPADPRGLYLESLAALGAEPAAHDLRFAEWRWESRALGTVGRGWHVLLDGLGITRVTWLREAAGQVLEPPSLEIAYGVERLLAAFGGHRDVFALPGEDERGRRREEIERSRYAFDLADTAGLHRRIEELEAEARRALEAGLGLSAYELTVTSLPLIDLLEARGELLGRDREAWLERLRKVVTSCAFLHLEELGRGEGSGDG